MSVHSLSPQILHDVEEEEQVDLDEEVDPEEMIDDEVEDEVEDVEETEKFEDEEGPDLDLNEDFQEEPSPEHENGAQIEAGVKSNGPESTEPVQNKKDTSQQEDKVEQKIEKNDELLSRPPHGCEVFVGGINQDTTEEELRTVCAPCGDIYEVRVLKEKGTGQNKGYAFVTFTTRESAEKAIETLGNTELKGRKLRFSESQCKHRLFIGNVPKSWEKEELEKILIEQGPGVEAVELLKDPKIPARNRGFAFVDYYNHACADNARKVMSKASFLLGSNAPTVSWADPRAGVDIPTSSAQVKVVYVRNLPDTVTEEQLKSLFERHGEVTRVVLPASKPGKMKRDYGFVHFSDRNSALKALEKTEKYELEGRILETSLAKPPSEKSSGATVTYPSQRSGILSHMHAGAGYNPFGGAGVYNQPLIYGRGPSPAGMAMVPMVLPDGRVGYVFQQPAGAGVLPQFQGARANRGASAFRQGSDKSGSGGSRRYHPY